LKWEASRGPHVALTRSPPARVPFLPMGGVSMAMERGLEQRLTKVRLFKSRSKFDAAPRALCRVQSVLASPAPHYSCEALPRSPANYSSTLGKRCRFGQQPGQGNHSLRRCRRPVGGCGPRALNAHARARHSIERSISTSRRLGSSVLAAARIQSSAWSS